MEAAPWLWLCSGELAHSQPQFALLRNGPMAGWEGPDPALTGQPRGRPGPSGLGRQGVLHTLGLPHLCQQERAQLGTD